MIEGGPSLGVPMTEAFCSRISPVVYQTTCEETPLFRAFGQPYLMAEDDLHFSFMSSSLDYLLCVCCFARMTYCCYIIISHADVVVV